MRRFTDPLLFGVLFILCALAWWILDLRGAIPAVEDGSLAPMTVAVVVVIATPALLFVTTLAFVRALFNVKPRSFWAWMLGGTALAAVSISIANLVTVQQSLEVGFSTGVWLMAIAAFASLIALVLALTGAIPTAINGDSKTGNATSENDIPLASQRPGEPHLGPTDTDPFAPLTPAVGSRAVIVEETDVLGTDDIAVAEATTDPAEDNS